MTLLILFIVMTSCIGNNNPNNMIDFTYAGNLPVVGDTINNEVVHFIIDSGANLSLIDSNYYQKNKRKFRSVDEIDLKLWGIGGVSESRKSVTIRLRTSIGWCTFQETDLTQVIKQVNLGGYNVVGIIGSDFLRDGYVINYKTQKVTKWI